MKPERNRRNRSESMLALDVVTLAILLCISVIGLLVTGYITWGNANEAGRRLANSYCMAEEYNFNTYKDFLEIGANYIADMEDGGLKRQEVGEYLTDYFEEIRSIVGIDEIEPYAVIDGVLIMSDREVKSAVLQYNGTGEQMPNKDFMVVNQTWYKEALAAKGEVIVTDVYTDQIYGKPVITLAKACRNHGDVIAIDMLPADFREFQEKQSLPQGSISYVYDSKGMLFYSDGAEQEKAEGFEAYTKQLFEKVSRDGRENGFFYDRGFDGRRRVVYYRKDVHDGYCVLTIPYGVLLLLYGKAYITYVFAFIITIVLIFGVWAGSYRKRMDNERMNETVQVLGSSYYSLYRVNLSQGSYENIKGVHFLGEDFPKCGRYEELLQRIAAVMHKDTRGEFLESFSLENMQNQVEKHIQDFGGDFQRSFDGVYEWVNVRMLYEPSLSKKEVVICFRKAEEEKRAQLRYTETLKAALDAAKQSENTQKQFFANMSHDMRTPLNGIIGISEIAGNHVREPEKMEEYLGKIRFSSRQLLELINDILEISRLEQGIVLDNSQFDFGKNLEDCLNVFALRAESQGKQLVKNYKLQEELVFGDSRRLTQVLNNLLSNALKFTKEGDRITVKLRRRGEGKHLKYQISISDTGVGMSQEFLEHIFEPYRREKRFSSRVEGTGLGMPIVKSIVSQMGGEITVESTLNEGTTFTVTLPFEKIEEKAPKEEKQHSSEVSPAVEIPPAEAGQRLKGKRILLTEDYELNMEISTEILEMEGAEVVQAWNGREALERFQEFGEYEFSAILMDMQMPEMDGCQATEAIRALERADAKEIPIIALTANAFAENIVSTTKAGMNAHIVKPIDVDLLCETMGRLIAEHENRRKAWLEK